MGFKHWMISRTWFSNRLFLHFKCIDSTFDKLLIGFMLRSQAISPIPFTFSTIIISFSRIVDTLWMENLNCKDENTNTQHHKMKKNNQNLRHLQNLEYLSHIREKNIMFTQKTQRIKCKIKRTKEKTKTHVSDFYKIQSCAQNVKEQRSL
jgi:hypothetical protein